VGGGTWGAEPRGGGGTPGTKGRLGRARGFRGGGGGDPGPGVGLLGKKNFPRHAGFLSLWGTAFIGLSDATD